jgi:D-alanyl-D-alanine dipeptidase
MPTGFDDFTALADRDYADVGSEAAANALRLETTMIAGGFSAYSGEWWHFSDTTAYAVEEEFSP